MIERVRLVERVRLKKPVPLPRHAIELLQAELAERQRVKARIDELFNAGGADDAGMPLFLKRKLWL